MTERECHLYYEDNRSNKEYHLKMERAGSGYKVIAEFGPRNGTLTYVDKTKGKPVPYGDAIDIYNKTEREKRSKGYEDIEPYSKLVKHLKKTGFWLTDYQWETIAKSATEYFEGQ